MTRGYVAPPRSIWVLGFVSMLMDVSSEMVHALLPILLVSGLGASAVVVGVIEGVAEATASATKVFSGWLSDRIGRRKLITAVGYSMSALMKPVFPLATTPFEVLGARFLDRLGKGVRGAPRDAMIADIADADGRGGAFGLRQSLDTVGAFAGPLIAMALLAALAGDIRGVLAWAVVPAAAAVILLVVGVKEPATSAGLRTSGRTRVRWSELRLIGRGFWAAVAVAAVFTLARFSEAFLILKAQDVGVALALVPGVLVVMNVVYAAVAAPAGALSDRIGRTGLLVAGLAVLIVADAVLAFSNSFWGVAIGTALWGAHMGLTQGVMSAMVADHAPASLRGTAFGVFHLAIGAATLAASVTAGWLWTYVGPQWTFFAGAAFAAAALVGALPLHAADGSRRRSGR